MSVKLVIVEMEGSFMLTVVCSIMEWMIYCFLYGSRFQGNIARIIPVQCTSDYIPLHPHTGFCESKNSQSFWSELN